ncbi:MAG: hypothetical protein AB8B85_22625 [Paracoccaceae bacterium]
MPNLAILSDIQKDAKLHAAFGKFLHRRQLSKLYEFARLHNEERTAFKMAFQDPSAIEVKFSKGLLKKGHDLHQQTLHAIHAKRKKEFRGDPDYEEKISFDACFAATNASPEWAKIFKAVKVGLNQHFAAFAQTEFPHTPEYAAYVREAAKAEAKKAAADLELEREVDEFLGLAVAVGTGDANTSKRLSQSLSKKHKPKKGKGMNPSQMIEFVKKKFGRHYKASKP